MIKTTTELRPGETVFVNGQRVTIEMVAPGPGDTCLIRHSLGSGTFKRNAKWLIEEPPDDIVEQAQRIAEGGSDQ